MAPTKIGIIVSTGNAHIRRYIYPSISNAELNNPSLILAGETMIQMINGPFANSAAWKTAVNNAIQAALSKPPGDPTCCVVDQNNIVVKVIMADAAIDSLPMMTLVQSYAPTPLGSVYNPATGLFTAPGFTIPANPARGVLKAINVPPTIIPKP